MVQAGEQRIQITASFGVTVVSPDRRFDAETAIQAADTALYAAKRNGRNCAEFMNPVASQRQDFFLQLNPTVSALWSW